MTADGRITVLIADDHAPTRAELRETIEADERFAVVAEAADAAEAVEAAVRERPDICLLDINMPGNGMSAVWEISGRLPSTHVVMLTVSRDERHLFAALRAGAAAYLLKDMDTRRLPHALCDVMRGETAIPRRMMRQIVDESATARRAAATSFPRSPEHSSRAASGRCSTSCAAATRRPRSRAGSCSRP